MTDTKPTLPTDKVNALWVKASDDAEGMRLGYTMQHHYFAALLQQQMIEDGWRQCAEGQGTTQFCAMAEQARKDAERQWVGLTEEEATELWERIDDRDSWELIMQVQAKLKEKNSG